MSIEERHPRTASKILQELGNFAVNRHDFIFRGHARKNYRLVSTLQRAHGHTIEEEWNTDYEEMLDKYESGLARIGKLPTELKTRRDILEHARHYGLPSPCIDFTYSPYIALFFALSALNRDVIRHRQKEYAVIYALNTTNLGIAYSKYRKQRYNDNEEQTLLNFIFPYRNTKAVFEKFNNHLPANELHFFPFPAKFNTRMQRQSGCFIYDTLNYKNIDLKDLEDFIEKAVDPDSENEQGKSIPDSILYKIFIPLKRTAEELLSHLELMGLLGMYLYDSPEGVSKDIENSYFYNSKTLVTRERLENKSNIPPTA